MTTIEIGKLYRHASGKMTLFCVESKCARVQLPDIGWTTCCLGHRIPLDAKILVARTREGNDTIFHTSIDGKMYVMDKCNQVHLEEI